MGWFNNKQNISSKVLDPVTKKPRTVVELKVVNTPSIENAKIEDFAFELGEDVRTDTNGGRYRFVNAAGFSGTGKDGKRQQTMTVGMLKEVKYVPKTGPFAGKEQTSLVFNPFEEKIPEKKAAPVTPATPAS